MGKPFKLEGGDLNQANIGRAADGKFAKLEQPAAHDLVEEAKDEGKLVSDVMRERRVPEKEIGSEKPTEAEGDAVYEDNLPWPEAGPVNDADKKPMKLSD